MDEPTSSISGPFKAKLLRTLKRPRVFIPLLLLGILLTIAAVPALGIYNYRHLKRDFPRIAPVYDPTIRFIRNYINEDLEYEKFWDVEWNAMPIVPCEEPCEEYQTPYTKDYFAGRLHLYGFNPAATEEATGLVMNCRSFEREKRTSERTRTQMLAYYVVFDTTADAKQFVALRRAGVNASAHVDKGRIDAYVNVCRKANFVVVAISEEKQLRVDYIKQKWGFFSNQMLL